MHIDVIIQTFNGSGYKSITIPDSWAQGRTVYGGLTAALIYHSMNALVLEATPDENRPIRYLNISFIGPIMINAPISFEVELLRSGRSASQLITYVKQNGKTCVIGQACFGIKRESKIHITDKIQHMMEKPKKANFIPQIPKVVPKFLRHIDINIQEGRLPFMRSKKDHLHGWMRYKKTPKSINDGLIIALIDAWPCTILQQLKRPAPASTMNWNIEFPQNSSTIQNKEWLAYQSSTVQATDGYVHTDASVWNEAGELLALSRQTVGVFG